MPQHNRGRGTLRRLGMSPSETYMHVAYFHESSFLADLLHADINSAVTAMRLGAVDLLEKPFSRERLVEVVIEALRRSRAAISRRLEEDDVNGRLNRLSMREREVFDTVAEGLVTSRAIEGVPDPEGKF